MRDISFEGLNKCDFDFERLKQDSHYSIAVRNTVIDEDEEGFKYYTLYDGVDMSKPFYGWYMMYSWARGTDQYGFMYRLERDELIEFIERNDSGHIFIESIKTCLGL